MFVAASAKHFLGYSCRQRQGSHDRAGSPSSTLREYFLPPFAAAIQAGDRTVMVNSGEINGIPVHLDRWILTDLLREELGFDGVTD